MAPAHSGLTLDDHLCFSIYSAGLAIGRAYKPLLDGIGITYPQYLVLRTLWEENAQSVGAISERLALESSTLTPLLKRLEAAGLVTRTRNPADERQVVIRLTPSGRALETRSRCLVERMTESSGYSPSELKKLNRQVRGLSDAISAHLAAQASEPGVVRIRSR